MSVFRGAPVAIDNTKLPLVGGTLTGALVLAGNPASALQAATKQYVDNATTVAALTALMVSLPTSLPGSAGQLWNNGGVINLS